MEIREYTRTQTATGILLTEDNLWEAAELAVQQGHVTSAGVFTEHSTLSTERTVRGLSVRTVDGEYRIHIGEVVVMKFHSAYPAVPESGEWQEAVEKADDTSTGGELLEAFDRAAAYRDTDLR